MAMASISVGLEFDRFILDPMTVAKHTIIDVQKKSGLARLKAENKREEALKAELRKHGITEKQWLALQKEAKQQWYYNAEGYIYIPAYRMHGAFVQAITKAPKAFAGPYTPDNFRHMVAVSDFVTQLKEPTGVYGRFVKLEGSVIRSWQEHEFIGRHFKTGSAGPMIGKPFQANGTVECDQKDVDTMRRIFDKVMTDTGVGSARKMGFGRGRVVSWTVTPNPA